VYLFELTIFVFGVEGALLDLIVLVANVGGRAARGRLVKPLD
jgi:hypothetical protein